MKLRRRALIAGMTAVLGAMPFFANDAKSAENWDATLKAANGQTVYFNAWGGEQRINDFIDWAGSRIEQDFGVSVVHVKLSDTADAVTRVASEKAAGTDRGGAVDLIWINGENFASMKENGLLLDPWVQKLPNWPLTNPDDNASVRVDFTIPTDGMESPWAKAQLVFYHDSAIVPEPPKTAADLLNWSEANPGLFTYPLPPNFLGTSFLKQLLIELSDSDPVLQAPATTADFSRLAEPLFDYLDALHPSLWRSGKTFPQGSGDLRRLMGDSEIGLAMTFNPADAPSGIANGELPDTVRTFAFEAGSLGNVNFLAIPFNAANQEGAMVLANFLLSPEAQSRMQDPKILGNLTVLDVPTLSENDRVLFEAIDVGVGGISPDDLGRLLLEPHPSWVTMLEEAWAKRYGVQ